MNAKRSHEARRRASEMLEHRSGKSWEAGTAPTKLDTDPEEFSVPLKIFDGTKKVVSDISEQSRSYLWLRRIKEIFLQLGTHDDSFVDLDMDLARADLLSTFDVYLRNDFSKLNLTNDSSSKQINELGLIQKIEESVNQLRTAETQLANAGVVDKLYSWTDKLTADIQALQQCVNNIAVHLQNHVESEGSLDDVRQAFHALPKQQKSQLKKRQEWGLKNLYSEVFKLAYKQNRLRTSADLDELKPIKKGNEKPNFGNAIWWYSCNEASIYFQVNNILKLENFELLMAYRYYVSDLCKMIEYIYKQDFAQSKKVNKYYRAASIDAEALKQMQKSLEEKKKGQVISIGGFISTTTDPEISALYARTQFLPEGNVRVLFEISVLPDQPCAAHAYIGNISFHPEEEEVLFSIGTVFVVNKVDEPCASIKDRSANEGETTAGTSNEEKNYYTLHVTASDIDKTIVDEMRAKIQDCSAPQLAVLLARYLLELGEYRTARKYLTSICVESKRTLKDDPVLASAFNCLGMTYARQNLHANAIEHYKQALNCQIRTEYSDNNALAEIYNNLGLSYIKLKRMAEAQAIFEEAERIQLREPASTRAHLASIYANIAYVHYADNTSENSADESEKYFKKAVRLYDKITKKSTYDVVEKKLMQAECYTSYAHLLSSRQNLDAQKFYDDALKIYNNILPDGDPKLLRAHVDIMMECAGTNNFSKVIQLYENTTIGLISVQAKKLFSLEKIITQEELVLLLESVGACYIHKGEDYAKAMDVWIQAYELERKAKLVQLLVPSERAGAKWQRQLIDKAYRNAYKYFTSSSQRNGKFSSKNNFSCGLLCAKQYLYKDAINHLTQAVKESENVNAAVLLADMYLAIDELENAERIYINLLDQRQTQDDPLLLVELTLSSIECYDDDTRAVRDLKQLETQLNASRTDIISASLLAMIYDTLAKRLLKSGDFAGVMYYADAQSATLKIRSFSQYHLSLASNYIIIAKSCVRQDQYREALNWLQQALRIQELNLANEDMAIELVYYEMGDTYCKLNQLDQARAKYDMTAAEIDEDLDQDAETVENQDDYKEIIAKISMHQHLAKLYDQRGDLKTAIEEQSASIEHLEELYPETGSQQQLNIRILVSHLEQLCFYHERLADTELLGEPNDPEEAYQKALLIQAKLHRFSDRYWGEIVRKIGWYYDHEQNDKDAAIASYQIAINEHLASDRIISTCYALDRLLPRKKSFKRERAGYLERAIKLIPADDLYLKAMVQAKQSATIGVTENGTAADEALEDNDESDDDESDVVLTTNGESIQPSFLPDNEHTVSEMVDAYRRLDDQEGLITYLKNVVGPSSASMAKSNFSIPSYDEADFAKRAYIQILCDILRLCAEKSCGQHHISDAYFQWALIFQTKKDYKQAINHYFQSFILRNQLGEQGENNTKLIGWLEKLKKNNLKDPKTLVSEYTSISTDDASYLWLKLAVVYSQCDRGVGNWVNWMKRAVKACMMALKDDSQLAPMLRTAAHYIILRIYKDWLHIDKRGKISVEKMARDGDYKEKQEHLTLFDQYLIGELAREFSDELDELLTEDKGAFESDDDDDDDNDNEDIISEEFSSEGIPNNITEQFYLPSLADAMDSSDGSAKCLGDTLISLGDQASALHYWKWIISECESLYPKPVQRRIYEENADVGSILDELHQLQKNSDQHLLDLVDSRKQLARFFIKSAELCPEDSDDAADFFKKAKDEYETARDTCEEIGNIAKSQLTNLDKLSKDIERKLALAALAKPQETTEDESYF